MIYSVFAQMCYYAMFTSCLSGPMCGDDGQMYKGKTDEYCNFVLQETNGQGFDAECFTICKLSNDYLQSLPR